MKYITTFPDWYDDRGTWCMTSEGKIIVAHPDHAPMIYDVLNDHWEEIIPVFQKPVAQ